MSVPTHSIRVMQYVHHSQYLCITCSPGCIEVTSAEDGAAETSEGQYLILQGSDDGELFSHRLQ